MKKLTVFAAATAGALLLAQSAGADVLQNITVTKVNVGPSPQVRFSVSDETGELAVPTSCPNTFQFILDPDDILFRESYAVLLMAFMMRTPLLISFTNGECVLNRQVVRRFEATQ